jgi:hypothetical protein
MTRTLSLLFVLLVLASCSSANIAANEAAVGKFFQAADADLKAAWAGVLQNCQAIEALVIDAQVISCIAAPPSKSSTNVQVQNGVQRAIAAANAVCNAPQPPGPATMGSVVTTIAAAYRAAKTAQQGNGCGV